MTIPSFDPGWEDNKRRNARICVLEVRDRDKPDAKPMAWLLVEREETFKRSEPDELVYEASIRLHYERIAPKYSHNKAGRGCFTGSYSAHGYGGSTVSLTSPSGGSGSVFLDLPGLEGQRIGTYLMNEIVSWVKQWPDSTVRSVEVIEGQSHDENKVRRNTFYENFGLVFDFEDAEHRQGRSRPMLSSALRPRETWKANLRERHVGEYIAEILDHKNHASFELNQRQKAIQYLIDERKSAEERPVRWALRQVWWRIAPTVSGAGLLAVFGVIAWFKYTH